MSVEFCAGIAPVADRYDVFLVDQWGVLHDGRMPYAGAVDCLRRLVEAGKTVVLISNSGRRAASEERLHRLGISAACYSHLVTSGEIAWQMLAAGEGFCRTLTGKRCALFASDAVSRFADGLPVTLATLDTADFILLSGMDDSRPTVDYERMIEAGNRRGFAACLRQSRPRAHYAGRTEARCRCDCPRYAARGEGSSLRRQAAPRDLRALPGAGRRSARWVLVIPCITMWPVVRRPGSIRCS